MELLLIKDKLRDLIFDEAPNTVTEAWTQRDDQARANIGPLVEDKQLIHIRRAKTVQEVWASLQ